MKVCPKCQFSNEDICPICVWCNRRLLDVESTQTADSTSSESEREFLIKQHHVLLRKKLLYAAIVYWFSVTTMTALIGFIFLPHILFFYFGSAVIVTVFVYFNIAGQMTTGFLQGFLSFAILWFFTEIDPVKFYMVMGHNILATVYWHWENMIIDEHR